MEAPEKIYIPTILTANSVRFKEEGSIEYIRADAFIEKTKQFLWTHIEGSDSHVNHVLKEFEKYIMD